MTEADHDFDPSTMPRIAHADPSLPGTLELGVFSLSLTVADLAASRAFYEALGFEVTGGDAHGGWLILKNGETTLGLFAGMFDRNMLTFNPGMTARMERLDSFTGSVVVSVGCWVGYPRVHPVSFLRFRTSDLVA